MDALGDDELYAKALLYRDNKVPGQSREASITTAENMFLKLADKGNAKAMHNYASIQMKKENYEKAFEYWSRSDLPASKKNCEELKQKRLVYQDVYLVIGSDRATGAVTPPFVKEIYGSKVDLSHKNTFGGNAITMDVNPVQLPGSHHIMADASTFDFVKNKMNIKHVVCERLPTAAGDLNSSPETYRLNNITGKVVQQLAKAMQPGAVLELEWEPYTSLVDMNSAELDIARRKNPFQAFLHGQILTHSTLYMHAKGSTANLPAGMGYMEGTAEYAAMMIEEFQYFLAHGMRGTLQLLIDRVYEETFLFINMKVNPPGTPVLVDYDPMTSPMEVVASAVRAHWYHPCLKKYNDGAYVHAVPDPTNRCLMRKGYVFHDPDYSILNKSLGNVTNTSIGSRINTPYVIRYLEASGFREVTVERRTNEHNGRQNVWMVRAIRA